MKINCIRLSKHENGGTIRTEQTEDFDVKVCKEFGFKKFKSIYEDKIEGNLKSLFEKITGEKVNDNSRTSQENKKDRLTKDRGEDSKEA